MNKYFINNFRCDEEITGSTDYKFLENNFRKMLGIIKLDPPKKAVVPVNVAVVLNAAIKVNVGAVQNVAVYAAVVYKAAVSTRVAVYVRGPSGGPTSMNRS